ncbi:MAG: hypothetical protein JWL71_2584 [Acidobacteria bacterium]|jgi:hypothetical protein|nr:hypothetical protein [Acidobacteriota bacterium]
MKRMVLVGALVGAFAASTAFAQTADTKKTAPKGSAGMGAQGGHAAPKSQPPTESATAPDGQIALGSVHIPKGVKADGKPLAAGTYQVRLTPQTATPDAKGQGASLERWVEFVKGGKVAGREVVTIIPQSEIDKVQKDAPPKANSAKVETLKGGDYMRLWINKGGNHYLVHFPA